MSSKNMGTLVRLRFLDETATDMPLSTSDGNAYGW